MKRSVPRAFALAADPCAFGSGDRDDRERQAKGTYPTRTVREILPQTRRFRITLACYGSQTEQPACYVGIFGCFVPRGPRFSAHKTAAKVILAESLGCTAGDGGWKAVESRKTYAKHNHFEEG